MTFFSCFYCYCCCCCCRFVLNVFFFIFFCFYSHFFVICFVFCQWFSTQLSNIGSNMPLILVSEEKTTTTSPLWKQLLKSERVEGVQQKNRTRTLYTIPHISFEKPAKAESMSQSITAEAIHSYSVTESFNIRHELSKANWYSITGIYELLLGEEVWRVQPVRKFICYL